MDPDPMLDPDGRTMNADELKDAAADEARALATIIDAMPAPYGSASKAFMLVNIRKMLNGILELLRE